MVDPGEASLGKRLGRCHCLVSAGLLRMSVHNGPAKVDHVFIAADGFFLLRHCVALIARDTRLGDLEHHLLGRRDIIGSQARLAVL